MRDRTFNDVLSERARLLGEEPLYRYLSTGDVDGPTETWSYAELDRRARAIAARLQDASAAGERALLLYTPGLDFIAGFFGCLYAGVIAIPTYPPEMTRLERSILRLRAIVADAGARFVLTSSDLLGLASGAASTVPDLGSLQWIATDELPRELGARWTPPPISGATVAFLQYTSGSTGTPKGVMVRHDHLLHNSEVIAQKVEHDRRSTGVGWLPMFHDMGLIGNVLQPLYVGFAYTLMSPTAFLERPMRWLTAISHFQATTSGGPNFAYELCIRKATQDQISGLNLRSWTTAFNGAEPIRHATLETFAQVFAPTGFRRESAYPCYGLAESTLMVTGARKASGPRWMFVQTDALEQGRAILTEHELVSKRALVSSGQPGADLRVEIVEPATHRRVEAGAVGEIWVRGPSVTAGYWNRPDETALTFGARLADTDEGPFLRTGDLGFLHEGELFVTGRLKDLLIFGGRNHYPQDIERVAEFAHPAVRPGCCAAFGVDIDGEERLVVAVELNSCALDASAVARAVRQAIYDEHGLYAHAVVLLAPRSIPKTTSGKIQRRACREGFVSGTLDEVARCDLTGAASAWRDVRPETQAKIARIVGDVLSVEQVSPEDNLFSLGLHSLLATQVVARIRDAFGVEIPIAVVFDAPSVAALAAAVEARPDNGRNSIPPPIRKVAREEAQLASFAQQRMWFLEQLAPEAGVYNETLVLRLEGALNVDILSRAIEAVIQRHEALRTTFNVRNGDPVQVVHATSAWALRREGVSVLDDAALAQHAQEDSAHLFDLQKGPLLRTTLLRLGADEHAMIVTVHHIACDGWSVGVFVRELAALYEAFSAGRTSPLLPLPSQYADYAAWQRQWLTDEVMRDNLAYWKQALDGVPPLDLPTDRPRARVQTHRGAALPVALSKDLSDRLVELSRREGVTLFMTLLAAFKVLLHRYSGQDDIVVGSPVAGRTLAETDGMIGLFVNTIVLRTDLSGAPTFRELLARVRAVTLAAYAHQQLPFEKLVEAFAPTRDPGRSPLFQVMLVLHSGPQPPASMGEVKLGIVEVEQRTAKFELSLSLQRTEERIRGALEYNTDLFDAMTIERMLGHYETLLRSVVSAPECPVPLLPLMSDAERRQILAAARGVMADSPADVRIHELFEAQANRTPEAVAVVSEGQQLTYRELNQWSNQLARHLRAVGVGPDVKVALCMERSVELVVGLLGVLKAGGAYIPLDPEHPQARLAFMIADAGASVMLTQSTLLQRLSHNPPRLVCIDSEWGTISGLPSDALKREEFSSTTLAYIIYTSGSTGEPKGVMVPHCAMVNHATAAARLFELSPSDRILQFATIGFDLSVEEIFPTLISGAALVLRTDETLSPRLLSSWLEARKVSVVNLPTAYWHLWVEELSASGRALPGCLRLVIVGGEEALTSAYAAWCRVAPPQVRWVNTYGPTEATVTATLFDPQQGGSRSFGRGMPIGRPIPNVQAHVLDSYLSLVPTGVPGELYIGGAGVARGYLNRPTLTSERFVSDPFLEQPGTRLYKTGDLCRWRSDGALEYMGRLDHQVKIRGFRIELGEIESVLIQHPAIREAVVLAREDTPGERQLVAYLTARKQTPPEASELRRFLREKLPDYMVPVAFVTLTALPMTPSGKVDRGALAAPDKAREAEGFVAARTPIEEVLAGIFARVLRVERVSVSDNFFELGGHSLLATRVISRLRELFRVEVPLLALFESPTVAGLTERVEAELGMRSCEDTPPLVPVTREQHAPLSFAQRRLWLMEQAERRGAASHMPAAIRLRGALDVESLQRAIEALVARHESLRTTFTTQDGEPLQQIHAPCSWALPVEAVSAQEEAGLAARMHREAIHPFDLRMGPLLRTTLLRLNADEHVLLVTMHHIISDGWSMGVLIRELAALYTAFRERGSARLAALPIQYGDFSVWEQAALQGPAFERHLEYWKERLRGATALALPTDRPRPEAPSYRGRSVPVTLSPSALDDTSRFSRGQGATLFMTLLAAFAALLGRYAGQTDICVGTPIANRTQGAVEGLIGLFVNMLGMRIDLSGTPTFSDLVAQVREVALGAYAHQQVPFQRVVEALGVVQQSSGRHPLYQVVLILQNALMEELALPGLTASIEEVETGASKVDLVLSLEEGPGGLTGTFRYATDLFDESTVSRMAIDFITLLAAAVRAPHVPISRLPLPCPHE